MLYISTDYVSDVRNPPYQHDSPTNPLNDYGISKLDREKIVLNLNQGITFEMTKTILYLYGRKFYAKLLNL